MSSEEEQMQTTSVVLPKPLLSELRVIAKAEGRSFASQVRIFLADAVTRKNTAECTEDANQLQPEEAA